MHVTFLFFLFKCYCVTSVLCVCYFIILKNFFFSYVFIMIKGTSNVCSFVMQSMAA